MSDVCPDSFFGHEGAKHWRLVFDHAHAFARATDCPLGADVFEWFRSQGDAYSEALKVSRKDGASQQKETQS